MNDRTLGAILEYQGVRGIVVRNGIICSVSYSPERILIPEGIIGLHDSCFSGQDNLLYVRLPRSVALVGDNVFSNCINLKVIRIHDEQKELECKLRLGNNCLIEYIHDLF